MAKETKKTTKTDVKVKDLKPKKDPKGGNAGIKPHGPVKER